MKDTESDDWTTSDKKFKIGFRSRLSPSTPCHVVSSDPNSQPMKRRKSVEDVVASAKPEKHGPQR